MAYLGRQGVTAPLTSADIPDNSITTAKIVDDNVTAAKVAADVATQAELDAAAFDDNVIQTNIALLAFKTAVNGSLAKYNLQDQVIDEYTNASGIDTGASTYEELTAGVYRGEDPTGGDITPTITHDADATGTDGDYTWYKWTDTGATGSYSSNATQDHEVLIVAGGGAGGGSISGAGAGGGGAGGYRTAAALSLVSGTTYTITVGAGAGTTSAGSNDGADGSPSSITGSDITNIESAGGGGGARAGATSSFDGRPGGSGGGSGGANTGAYGGNGGASSPVTSPVQGYKGGDTDDGGGYGVGGGGSSATAASTPGSVGGAGTVNDITGVNVTYAAGGQGPNFSTAGAVGAVNTGNAGGGGGQANTGGAGGSGVVILRRLTAMVGAGPGDLILQSTDTEAEAQPTKADMVMLVEDAGSGVGTVNTHVKGWISRDSGTTFTQGTLVDEGDWGTDKRILAFHDLDISGQPADQTMCYKITTHSASAVYDTKIHATSMGWR